MSCRTTTKQIVLEYQISMNRNMEKAFNILWIKQKKISHKLITDLCKSGTDSKMAELSTEKYMHESFTKGVIEPYKTFY